MRVDRDVQLGGGKKRLNLAVDEHGGVDRVERALLGMYE